MSDKKQNKQASKSVICDKCWVLGYSAQKTEFQKMLEFFFPKSKMHKEERKDNDPWEFL